MLTTVLLGSATVRLLAQCAKAAPRSSIVDAHGLKPIVVKIVNDEELSGEENVDQYRAGWQQYVGGPSAFRALGFSLIVDGVDFTTEQKEPLLLLADYAAGSFLLREHGRARCPSSVSTQVVANFIERLLESPRFHVAFERGAELYPDALVRSAGDAPTRRSAVDAWRNGRAAKSSRG